MARCSERTVHIQGAMHPFFLKWLENHRRLNARSSLRVSLHLLHFTCSVPEHPSSFWYSLLPQTGQNLQPMLNCACCILFSGLLLKERLFAKERLFDWIIFILQNGWCPMGGSERGYLLWPASCHPEYSKRPLQRISHGGTCSHYALECLLHFLDGFVVVWFEMFNTKKMFMTWLYCIWFWLSITQLSHFVRILVDLAC